MRITRRSLLRLDSWLSCGALGFLGLGVFSFAQVLASDFPEDPLAWPKAGLESKPWTRWWWLGSAVDPQEITRELESFSKAGLGGVEICPIYGAEGAESRYLPFLSQEWMAALEHTLKEARRLGMGVDLTTGTGWPFGGPNVEASMASSNLTPFRKTLSTGGPVSEILPKGRVVCLRAESGSDVVDLVPFIRGGKLEWNAPSGAWKLLGLFSHSPIQKVKRAAPGGEGSVLDPFSSSAMDRYFDRFAKGLSKLGPLQPRAHFHDSFEYYQAAWTSEFPKEFQMRRGYDLLSQLGAFEGDGDPGIVARVRSDYRLTLDELHRDYLQRWHDHAHENGSITRNQAHGSPGNLLDHYAVSEIPETEIFQEVSEDQIPMLRFASSAAHVTGRKLSSSESFTWLDEHFQVRPAKLKDAADFVFLGGANHLFFHGIPYSPPDAGWPGWLFYASTHLGENGGLWRDLPTFSGYLRRCQSVLQSGEPTADVLIYFPMEDIRSRDDGMLPLLTIHDQAKWLWPTPFYRSAMELWNTGHPFDFVSDHLLEKAKVVDGGVQMGNVRYPVLSLPGVKRIPLETLRRVLALAENGATVVFTDGLPTDVPGFHQHAERLAQLLELLKPFAGKSGEVPLGKGRVVINPASLSKQLESRGNAAESMVADGLRFVRRTHEGGFHYFIANRGTKRFSGKVRLAVPFRSAVVLDPWSDAAARTPETSGSTIHLDLEAGASCIVRTFTDRQIEAAPVPKDVPTGEPLRVEGPWTIDFIAGGPSLPSPRTLADTSFWTTLKDKSVTDFSGTVRYRTSMEIPVAAGSRWRLDLGDVRETARVFINGKPAGISWSPPHRMEVSELLKPGENLIEIEVTNLAANRIADLDRRGVSWKRFHEINFVGRSYKPFDASAWPIIDSGLGGPVLLQPLAK